MHSTRAEDTVGRHTGLIVRFNRTLLRVLGAASGAGANGDLLGLSELELRDELLLDSSLLARLNVEVKWRKDSTNSVGSQCCSCGASWRCLCVRSLQMTCASGMLKAWGVASVGKDSERTDMVVDADTFAEELLDE